MADCLSRITRGRKTHSRREECFSATTAGWQRMADEYMAFGLRSPRPRQRPTRKTRRKKANHSREAPWLKSEPLISIQALTNTRHGVVAVRPSVAALCCAAAHRHFYVPYGTCSQQ